MADSNLAALRTKAEAALRREPLDTFGEPLRRTASMTAFQDAASPSVVLVVLALLTAAGEAEALRGRVEALEGGIRGLLTYWDNPPTAGWLLDRLDLLRALLVPTNDPEK